MLLLMAFHRHRVNIGTTRRFEDGIAVVTVGFVAPAIRPHVARVQQHHPMTPRLRHPPPVMRRTAGLHHPLDRLRLLLYISPECLRIESSATIHPADMDTFGNLVNGLGQIDCYAFHCHSPSKQTPRSYRRNAVRGESITAFKSFA